MRLDLVKRPCPLISPLPLHKRQILDFGEDNGRRRDLTKTFLYPAPSHSGQGLVHITLVESPSL